MMTLKVFWLYMLVALVMSILLIQVAYFIFVLKEVGLTLIKLLMILFYYETIKDFLLVVWVQFKLECKMALLGYLRFGMFQR